jgi:hypothetical protein
MASNAAAAVPPATCHGGGIARSRRIGAFLAVSAQEGIVHAFWAARRSQIGREGCSVRCSRLCHLHKSE